MDLNKLERMGRRRFMETMAGAGVSATTLNYLDQDELRDIVDNPEDEVPFVERVRTVGENGESIEEPVYNTIERNEWERRQAALNVRDKIQEQVAQEYGNGATASFIAMDDSPIDFGVEVLVNDFNINLESVSEVLSETSKGEVQDTEYGNIPVTVRESKPEKLDYAYTNFDPVPGGQRILSREVDGISTLMGKMQSDQHGEGWVAAGHAVALGETIDEVINDGGYAPTLGDVEKVVDDGPIDCAFISETQDAANQISDEGNSYRDLDVVGYIPDEAIENYVGDKSIEVTAQGQATGGRKSGAIVGVEGSPTEALRIDPYMAPGDSGGPIFESNSQDEAWLYGLITDRRPIYNTRGTTIETIMDELNISMP